jgi:hypothetical protein
VDPPSDGLWMITWMCHVLDHGSGDVIHGDGMTDTPWTSVWGPGVPPCSMRQCTTGDGTNACNWPNHHIVHVRDPCTPDWTMPVMVSLDIWMGHLLDHGSGGWSHAWMMVRHSYP